MWYFIVFLISMVPIVEIRGAIPVAVANDLNLVWAYIVCILGNMLPVPIIYLFARKVLIWGSKKKYIGKFFTFCLEKGEKGGGNQHHAHMAPAAGGQSRQRPVCCAYAFCGNPSAGYRSVDRNSRRKHFGYGL